VHLNGRQAMVDVLPSKALYYPHLDFGTAAWVKSALLYWDGLVRIVSVVKPHDDPEIRELVEAGLIENVRSDPFFPRVAQVLGERLEDLMRQRGGLPDSIPISRGLRGRRPDLVASAMKQLACELEHQGRGQAAQAMHAMPEQALTLGVTVAAQTIAGERRLAPATDDPIFAAINTYFGEAKVMRDPKSVPDGFAAADLLVPTPSLEAMAGLPVGRLLEVRSKLANQRRSFRQKIEAEKTAISALPNIEAVTDHLKALASAIRDDLEAQRDLLRQAEVRDAWSFLSVSAPASLAVGMTVAELSGPILGPIGGIGAVALGATNWFVQRRKGRDESSNYMLSLEGVLGRKGRGLEAGLNELLSR
jgi:hypothetical protein